jgi:hypothetical protein
VRTIVGPGGALTVELDEPEREDGSGVAWRVEESGHRWAWAVWVFCALVVTAAAALSGCVFDNPGDDSPQTMAPTCPGLWCINRDGVTTCMCGADVKPGPDAQPAGEP